MQYTRLKKLIRIAGAKDNTTADLVTLPLSTFMEILRAAVKSSPSFDEEYYLSKRPDLVESIKNGTLSSARDHYARTGYFEDALPGRVSIDEAYYLESNSDLAIAYRKRQLKDPQQHFETNGFKEGRLPQSSFSIWDIL